jgi:hypothetical protein
MKDGIFGMAAPSASHSKAMHEVAAANVRFSPKRSFAADQSNVRFAPKAVIHPNVHDLA